MSLHLRSLVAIVVMLSGCRSAHEVATTSYQAAAAPPVDVVRQETPNASSSTTTTTTGPPQNSPPVVQSVPVEPSPSPNPATTGRNVPSSSSTSSNQLQFPTAKPVEGKPGYVYSPFDPGKYVDVSGYAPGSKVKDPYSGKIFLVP